MSTPTSSLSIGTPTLLSHGDEGPPALDASWAFSNLAEIHNCFAPNLRHVVALVEDQVGAGLYNARRLAKYLKQVCTLLHANSSEVRSATKHENEKKSRVANDGMQLTVRLFETIQDAMEEQAAITQQFSMNVLKAVVDPLMTFHKDADQKRLKILATEKAITARNQATARAIEKARREAIDAWLDLKKMALEGDFPVMIESLDKFTKSSGSKKRHVRTCVLYPSGVLLWGDGRLGETTMGANCIERVVGVSRNASSELKLTSDEAERFLAIATTGKTLKVLCERKESVELWTSTVFKILAGKALDEETEKAKEKEKEKEKERTAFPSISSSTHPHPPPPPPLPRESASTITTPLLPPATSFNPTTGAPSVPLSSLPVHLTPAASSGEKAVNWKKEVSRIEKNFQRLQKAIVRTQKLFTTMEQLVVAANKELENYHTQELPELLEGLEKLEMTRLNVTKFFITKFAQLHGMHVEPSDRVRNSIKRSVNALDSGSQIMRYCENLVAQHSMPPPPQPYTDMLPCHWTIFTTNEYIKVQSLLFQDMAKIIEARNKGLVELDDREEEERRKRKAETKAQASTTTGEPTGSGGRTLVLPGGALVGLSAAGEKPTGEAFPEPAEDKEPPSKPASEEVNAQKQAFVASINEYRETLEKLGALTAEDEQYFSSFWDMDNLRKLNIYFEVLHSKTRRVKLLVLMKYFPLRFPQSEQIKLFLQHDNWFLWLLPFLQFPDEYQKSSLPKEDQELEKRLSGDDWKRLFGLILSVVMQVVRLGFDTFDKENKFREFLTQMFTALADRCSWGAEAIMFGRLQLWMLTNTIISDWSKRALPRFTENTWDNLFDLLYVIKEFLFFRPLLDPAATLAKGDHRKDPQPGLHVDDRGCLDLPLVGRVVALLELLVNKIQGQLMEYSPKKEKEIAMRIAEEAQFFLLLYESFNPNDDKDESNVGWHYSSERASRLLDFLRKKQYPYPSSKQMERMLSSINLVVTQHRSKKQLGDFAKFAGARYYSEHYGGPGGKNLSTTVRAVTAPVSLSISSRGKKSAPSVATTPTAATTVSSSSSSVTPTPSPTATTTSAKTGETKSDAEPEIHVMDQTEFNTMVAKSLMAATKLRTMSIVGAPGGHAYSGIAKGQTISTGSSPPRSRENSSELVEDEAFNPETPSPKKPPRVGVESSPPVSPGSSQSTFFPSGQPPELPASPQPPLPPSHPSFGGTTSSTSTTGPKSFPVLPAAPRPTSPLGAGTRTMSPTFTISPTRAKPINIIRVKQPTVSSSQLVDESSDFTRRATSPPTASPPPVPKPFHKRSRGVTLEPGENLPTSLTEQLTDPPAPTSIPASTIPSTSTTPTPTPTPTPTTTATPTTTTTAVLPPPLPGPSPSPTATPPPLPFTASSPTTAPPIGSSVPPIPNTTASSTTSPSPILSSSTISPPPLPNTTTTTTTTPGTPSSGTSTLPPPLPTTSYTGSSSPTLTTTTLTSTPSSTYTTILPPPLPGPTLPQSVPRDPVTPIKEALPPPRPPPGRGGTISVSSHAVTTDTPIKESIPPETTSSFPITTAVSPPPRPLGFARSPTTVVSGAFPIPTSPTTTNDTLKETPPPPRPRGSALATGTVATPATTTTTTTTTTPLDSTGETTTPKEPPKEVPSSPGPPPRPSGATRGPPPLPASFRNPG